MGVICVVKQGKNWWSVSVWVCELSMSQHCVLMQQALTSNKPSGCKAVRHLYLLEQRLDRL